MFMAQSELLLFVSYATIGITVASRGQAIGTVTVELGRKPPCSLSHRRWNFEGGLQMGALPSDHFVGVGHWAYV